MIELPRHPNGKRNRRLRRARTRAEAQRKLRLMRGELNEFGSLPSTGRTMDQSVVEYIEQVRRPASQPYGTRVRDEQFAEAATRFFGSRKIGDLVVRDIDAFLAAFASGKVNSSGRPVSADYVRRVRSFLVRVLRNDMRLGYINRNVAEIAEMPTTSTEPRNRRALSLGEWRTLHDRAQGTIRLVVDLAGRHGLRPQELRALRWSEVDIAGGTISVVTQFDSDDQFVDTKTVKSTRTIELHPVTAAEMAAWREEQSQLRAQSGDSWTGRNLIVSTRNGTALDQGNQRRSLRNLCQAASVPSITPYELRHTAITHQIDAGHSVAHVADWAGTSEQMIYKYYRHRIREVVRLAPVEYG